jgi:hypothetical protein
MYSITKLPCSFRVQVVEENRSFFNRKLIKSHVQIHTVGSFCTARGDKTSIETVCHVESHFLLTDIFCGEQHDAAGWVCNFSSSTGALKLDDFQLPDRAQILRLKLLQFVTLSASYRTARIAQPLEAIDSVTRTLESAWNSYKAVEVVLADEEDLVEERRQSMIRSGCHLRHLCIWSPAF